MLKVRRTLVTIGLVVGAIGAGAAASAAVGDGGGDDAVEPTTTTTEPTSTTEAETDVVDETTTEAPSTTEVDSDDTEGESTDADEPAGDDDADDSAGHDGEVPFGQCNAFSGRDQPGKSQAWERLNEMAGGDIEAFCEEVLTDHPGRHGKDKAEATPSDKSKSDKSKSDKSDKPKKTTSDSGD